MGKGWNSMIPEALWTYWIAFKTPIGQTPHQLIYGKTCHIPVDLEFRSHGAIKRWKMDLQSARIKGHIQWAELGEWRKKTYHSFKLYMERMKRWHDKRIKIKQFKLGNKVLLFDSHLHLFGHDKLRSKWKGPCLIKPPGQWQEYLQSLKIFLESELPELKEIDVYELSELEPPSMVIARP